MKKYNVFGKNNVYKVIALSLCIVLLIEAIPLFAFAEIDIDVFEPDSSVKTSEDIDASVDEYQEELTVLGEGELPQSQLKDLKPEAVQRPESVSLEKAIESGHVNRLSAQEKDLRVVMFQNQNGSKTTYVYDKPVKYVDESGKIRDRHYLYDPRHE